MGKKYYWLKLNDTFFEDDTIVWIEEQKNGKDYVIFYLKLLLRSLKEEGKLIRYVGEMVIPYDTEALGKLTNTDYDTVRVAMELFINIGLIKQIETGELYLTQINEMIGSETSAAERMRKSRGRNNESRLAIPTKCNNVQKCYTEIEIEKEIDIELEKENTLSVSKETDRVPYKEIIDYLNEKTNKNFRHTTEKTKSLIRNRIKEGFKIDDFKKVIDVKTIEWLADTERNLYLRPETLFSNKFEGYLNQEVKEKKVATYKTKDQPVKEYSDKEKQEINERLKKFEERYGN